MFKQGWRCQAALASRRTLHPEDTAVPGKSVIKFAGALQSFSVCLWDERQRFMARMHLPQHWFIFLIHPTDNDSMTQRPRVILVKPRCTERSHVCAILEQSGPKSAHSIFTEY